MVRPCISCGAAPAPEARFCRKCGTPLVIGSLSESESVVSPRAPTVPLEWDHSTTDSLRFRGVTRGEGGQGTTRISREDLERLMHKQTGERYSAELDLDGAKLHVPVTDTLDNATADQAIEARRADLDTAKSDLRRRWLVAAVGLLCVGCVAAVLAMFASKRIRRDFGAGGTQITLSDPNNAFEDQFAQAEELYKSGDSSGALARLRAAARLVPKSAVDHQRVGNLFLRLGANNEALNYLNQAVTLNVDNLDAWRGLAEAQFNAGKYSESASSYKRILTIAADDPRFEPLNLEYARALRMVGRSEEAHSLLERTSRSTDRGVSVSARQQLLEVSSAVTSVGESANHSAAIVAGGEPAASAVRRPEANHGDARSVRVMATQSPDSLFDEGVRLVGGRNPKTLQRAELVRALELFQYAARSGNRRSEAAKHAEQLGKEYDRRKNWK